MHNAEDSGINLIGSAEVCFRLDIDRSTLIRWCQLGRIQYAQKLPGPRGQYLFDSEYITEFAIRRGEQQHKSAS